eukprot:GCRY01003549.1.p1 GENE.GCRY01003549.1~~GCRY01003549.1.p1  ORF type:complete len:408 (+),score=84.01 GCRY01003549.1:205-1428(+)
MQSLFIINSKGEPFVEKHWRGRLDRAVCDVFWDYVKKSPSPEDLDPIIQLTKYFLLNVKKRDLYFIVVTQEEVPPLLFFEFMHRLAEILEDYFGNLTETDLLANISTVYQLLEEMADNGYPFTTEPNILREMVSKPSLFSNKSSAQNVPAGAQSIVPWRKSGVKYANNEIFLDIVEEMDTIIDSKGIAVSCELNGKIMCNSKLSAMPDLTLHFNNPHMMDDCSLHPCVRLGPYQQSRIMSFIPPDGQFKLCTFRVADNRGLQVPISIQPQFSLSEAMGTGKLSLNVSPRNTQNKTIEGLVLELPCPSVGTMSLSSTVGTAVFDQKTKVMTWTIGRLAPGKNAQLTGSLTLNSTNEQKTHPTLNVHFKINGFSASGLKVDQLTITNVKYKPFKGVRSITTAGAFQGRT